MNRREKFEAAAKVADGLKDKRDAARALEEAAKKNYEKASAALSAKINALEKERDAMYGKLVNPATNARAKADKAYEEADKVYRAADAEELFYGAPSLERMKRLAGYLYSFSFDKKVREVKQDRPGVVVYGFSEYDKALYLAYKDDKPYAALVVNKAQHRGDYSTSQAYGVKEVKKAEGGYSRQGYGMREFLNPEFVEFVGMTDKEVKELYERLVR